MCREFNSPLPRYLFLPGSQQLQKTFRNRWVDGKWRSQRIERLLSSLIMLIPGGRLIGSVPSICRFARLNPSERYVRQPHGSSICDRIPWRDRYVPILRARAFDNLAAVIHSHMPALMRSQCRIDAILETHKTGQVRWNFRR